MPISSGVFWHHPVVAWSYVAIEIILFNITVVRVAGFSMHPACLRDKGQSELPEFEWPGRGALECRECGESRHSGAVRRAVF